MAVVVDMVFQPSESAPVAGSPTATYDAVMAEAGLTDVGIDQYPGLIAHFAFEQAGALRVIDVWDSAEQWQSFTAANIGPAGARLGLDLRPEVTISELHKSIL